MTCKKIRFSSRDLAISFIRGSSWKGKLKTPTRAYWCGKCKAWHVTSVPKIRRR